MTLGQLQQRDARIAELEAMGRGRSRADAHELAVLVSRRDLHWRRLGDAIARARGKAAALEAYARQIGLPLDGGSMTEARA